MTNKLTTVELFTEEKKRLAELTERRTRAQVQLEAEQRALDEAKQEALSLFGTSDLEELRLLYKTKSTENEAKLMEFVMALDAVEQSVNAIERQINV